MINPLTVWSALKPNSPQQTSRCRRQRMARLPWSAPRHRERRPGGWNYRSILSLHRNRY